jgi:Zn-dependent M28 family amino/carboxypeptidase
MKIAHAKNQTPFARDVRIANVLSEVSLQRLRASVEMLSFPRHYFAEHRANRRARDLLLKQTRSFGYTPALQGSCDNIVMGSDDRPAAPAILLGAHYDSVPGTPGADDNASAVAVCLECARLIKLHNLGPVLIVFFNREEDGLLGSEEFVASLPSPCAPAIGESHIFEMVGYRDRSPGSQRLPHGLPSLFTSNAGDFLALLANSQSNTIAGNLLALAACYLPDFPVTAVKTYLGIEKLLGDLNRSDHAPFWRAGISSIMWTDTSEFRNPHYHLASDKPETLDYEFMADVAKLALARVMAQMNLNSCASS